MTLEQLLSISKALNVSFAELLGLEADKNVDEQLEINKLKQEIDYLKKIVAANEKSERATEKYIEQEIKIDLDEISQQLDVGRWDITNNTTGEVISVPGCTYDSLIKVPNFKEVEEGRKKGVYSIDLMFTKADIHYIRVHAIKRNFPYWNLLDTLGFIKDEEFKQLIKEERDRQAYDY